MKLTSDLITVDFDATASNEIILPQGIIGFSKYQRAELLCMPDHLPFLWMRLHGPDCIHFIVMEPGGLIPDYEPEIFDEDAEQLGIADASEVMVLNIVTLRPHSPGEASVNLVGPLMVNRRTRVGRQLVISNYSRYSAQYLLIDQTRAPAVARIA